MLNNRLTQLMDKGKIINIILTFFMSFKAFGKHQFLYKPLFQQMKNLELRCRNKPTCARSHII